MTKYLVATILYSAALAACGNSNPTNPPVDGCTGHLACGGDAGTGPALTDPEGGNVIFEYIYVDSELQAAFGLPTGVNTISRTMAYFMDAQTPQSNPFPAGGVCNNLDATKGWPLHVGSPHTDLDVGTLTISGVNKAGTATTIPMPKAAGAGTDAIGRAHNIYYQEITPNADSLLKFDTAYTVSMTGAGTVPATTLTGSQGLFLAENFTVNSPDVENNGPFIPGTDFTVKWTPATSANLPAGDEVLGLTWLLDSNGSPTHLCPTAHSAGTFTIPGATIAEYKAVAAARGTNPNKVILSRQAVIHHVARLPNGEPTNLRRVDMLGIVCWVQLMDVQ